MGTPDTQNEIIDFDDKEVNQSSLDQNIKEDLIPPQYKNLPSEVVKELWQNPKYINEDKNKSETEKKQKALEQIKIKEIAREVEKRKLSTEQYSQLPDEDKREFPEAQKGASKIIHEYIKGERDFEDLSKEEEFVLTKLKKAYDEFKNKNPDQKFSFDLSQDIDKQIFENLNYRLAFDVLNSQKGISNQEKANKIREDIGIPTQEINNDGLILPKKEIEKENEDFDSMIRNDYRKYAKEYYTKIEKATEQEAEELIKRSENLDATALTKGTIEKMYFLLRLHDYKGDENYDSSIDKFTEISSDKINSHSENRWHYRVPYYEKDGVKYHKTNEANFRISLNVNADKKLIEDLDKFIIETSKKPGSVYYKTPENSSDWLERHDPITIYFEDDVPEDIKEKIVNITKRYIRSKKDVLPGEKLSDGVAYESSPSKEKLQELVNRGYAVNKESGDAIKEYITKKDRLKASAGQVTAIEKFLEKYEQNITK
ncbi:hypothetical protein KAU19_04895 [Candidatus Parcubacteria bacterium]|nr:hypothetical protein [Candidatus Parcubacteria bacterium]